MFPRTDKRRNRVLASLEDDDFALIRPHLQPTSLKSASVSNVNRRISTFHTAASSPSSPLLTIGNTKSEVGLVVAKA
jgi:hypothetical protein